MWFLRSLERLDLERRSVALLLDEGWVTAVEWQVTRDDGLLCADVAFTAGGERRRALLLYPQVFPYAPPRVIPKDGERWSSHQWPSGELCLQFRAQTWSTEFTGGDLLRSARELLDTEATKDAQGKPLRVPSGHVMTQAVELRGSYFRLIVPEDVIGEVRRRGAGTWKVSFRDSLSPETRVLAAWKLSALDGTDAWTSPSVPEPSVGANSSFGLIALMEPGDEVNLALRSQDLAADQLWNAFTSEERVGAHTLIGVQGSLVLAKWMYEDYVTKILCVRLDGQSRNPARNNELAAKRVGIVGCGSMGSKVAASMARAGVGRFLLVDGDLLTNGNLVRHELDWDEVGSHKAPALAQRLKRIRPDVDVLLWNGHLGQSSTDSLLKSMAQLANCDLIVELTGSAQGFNYASAVATENGIPMVWGRIFAGGYGGLLARSRPGLDPHPLEVRRLIDRWCANPEFPEPPVAGAIDYSAEEDDQPAMIADDGDVMTISGMLARFATDALRQAERSDYPYSAYMVGLRKEWIFTEPFKTFPIDLGRPTERLIASEHSAAEAAAAQVRPAPYKKRAS